MLDVNDCEKVVFNIRKELENYLESNSNLMSLVCGISGGIDSALCVALARPVCDQLGLYLIGTSLPIVSNKRDEIERAVQVGENFCHRFWEDRCLESTYDMCLKTLQHTEKSSYFHIESQLHKDEKIRRGNLKARMRMIYLYNLAFANNGMVLSTDNYTEYLLGFWTRHGDEGDYGMIQFLFKTEVYEISKYLISTLTKERANALQLCIDAIPTDGLGVSESDLEQFGAASYDEVDKLLKIWTKWPGHENEDRLCIENHCVIKQHEKTHFKRSGCISIGREKLFK
jgi:NAD+ synthetase